MLTMSFNETHKSNRQKAQGDNRAGCILLGKRTLDPNATVSISKKTAVQKSIEGENNFPSKEIKNKLQASTISNYDATSIGETDKFECPRCCNIFNTLFDLMQHYCDRIYVDRESCSVKLCNFPHAAKKNNKKAKTAPTSNVSAKTAVEHNHTCEICPKCGHEYETVTRFVEHPCEKILVNMKSCFVKLDKLYHPSKKLQVSVEPKSNYIDLAETEVNNTCETCPECCSEFKTPAELANHSCDRVLAYMKSCVVRLDNLPLVSPKKNKLQATQKSNVCSIVGSEMKSNGKSCPKCGNEYKTFVEYEEHPCEKILVGMQSCVVQLDERLGLDVHTGGVLMFFECYHCKRVFLNEYFAKQHILHSAAKCNKNIDTLLLNVNNAYHPTTTTKINVVDNNPSPCTHQTVCDSSPESSDSTSSASQTSLRLNFEKKCYSKNNINDVGDFNARNSHPYTRDALPERSDSVSSASLSKPSFCSIS